MSKTNLAKQYKDAIVLIIDQQSKVIGLELAFDLANTVDGLTLVSKNEVKINRDPGKVLEDLVLKYSVLFGKISIEVSKNAISKVSIDNKDLPASLRY